MTPKAIMAKLFNWQILGMLGFLAVVFMLGSAAKAMLVTHVMSFAVWIEGQGIWGAVIYSATLCTVVMCGGITSVLEALPGFLYGVWPGALCSITGKTLGTWASFWLGKTVFRGWVQKNIHKFSALTKFGDALEENTWSRVFLVLTIRVAMMPYLIKNYGLSAFNVPFHVFASCSFISSFPFAVLWAYVGSQAKSVLEAVSGGSEDSKDMMAMVSKLMFVILGITVLAGVLGAKAQQWSTEAGSKRTPWLTTDCSPKKHL